MTAKHRQRGGATGTEAPADSVSLGDELAEVMVVLETEELLADMLDRTGFPSAEAAARAPRMMAGVIELALGRVTLLRKVVLQQADVSLLVGRRNRRNRIAPGEDQDVLLPVQRRR